MNISNIETLGEEADAIAKSMIKAMDKNDASVPLCIVILSTLAVRMILGSGLAHVSQNTRLAFILEVAGTTKALLENQNSGPKMETVQ